MSEEPDSFEFNMFPFLLDDIEPNKEAKKTATKKEIAELFAFIGGFEKWSLLNEDCRREVVKYLDYKAKCQLGICSKADYKTVDRTPIYVHSVEIQDNEESHYRFSEEKFDNVVVRVQFHHDYNSGKRLEWVFSQLGEDTLIQWLQYIPKQRPGTRQVTWKSCNYYEEAVKFAEKWMKKGNFEMNEIKIEMAKYPFATSQIKSLPRCKDVRIGADDVDSFNWWFQKLPEHLDDLQLITLSEERETFTLPSDFLNAPQVMQASKFYFWCRAAFTDKQFLKLKANSINFDCVDVTDNGINQFIKNWVNGKAVDGFKETHFWATKNRDQAALTRGLELRPWDQEFEEEACGFADDFARCCGRGQCFQISSRIDPFESLTLSIHSDRISIYATGKRREYNGSIYTDYSIP